MAARALERFSFMLLGSLLLLAPCARSQAAPAAAKESALAQALGLLDPKLFFQELSWWAAEERDGREAGTRAADEVAARASWQLSALGLQPLGDKLSGAPSFYQEFPLSGGRLRSVDPRKAQFRLAGKKLEMEADWALLGGPARVSVKGAPILFLGEGDDDKAFVDAGLEGKAALMWESRRGTPDAAGRAAWVAGLKAQAKRATEFGAVALLLAPAPGVERELHTLRQDLLGTRGQKIPVVQLSKEAAAALLSRLKVPEGAEISATGIRGASLEMAWEATEERKGKNVVALWQGSDPALSKEYIVIGAHRDHIGVGNFASRTSRRAGEVHAGADDNASGSVGVLEIARAFASAGLRPKRSLIFILFDAEEMGLVGSRYWVANSPVPIKQVVAMINLDMIGRAVDQKCSVFGTESSPVWEGLLQEAAVDSPIAFQAAGGGFGGSDHMSFQMVGIPAVFFFTSMHAQYHTADDTADLCDCEAAVEVLRVAARMAASLADASKRPAFQGRQRGERPPEGAQVQLGIAPRQTNRGVEVHKVTPDSPAAQAGLESGDLLLAVDGRSVKRISDLFNILRRKSKGQTVNLAWKRGERSMSGKARLE